MEYNKEDFKKIKEEFNEKLKKIEITGQAGGEFIKVKIDYQGNILKIDFEDNPHIKEDIAMLLDLVKMAYNSARSKIEEKMDDCLSEFTSEHFNMSLDHTKILLKEFRKIMKEEI